MLTNVEYWQSVYSSSKVPSYPSQFSVFVQSWLASNDATIIEVGCGNGRDSRFFHQMGHRVTVTDQVICDELQQFSMAHHNFAAVEQPIVEAIDSLQHSVDFSQPVVVYSRFFQHAISADYQQAMLNSLAKMLHKDSRLFFEFRLEGDADNPKEFGTSHYRRFQSADGFKASLGEAGLDCIYACEGKGYARYKSEDPVVGRFVAVPDAKKHLRLISSSETEKVPPATLRIDDKGWLHGVCNNQTEGLAELKVDEFTLTQLPLVPNADGKSSRFIFRSAQCLLSALPKKYKVTVALPCGTRLCAKGVAPMGSGDGSLKSKLEDGYLVSAKAGYLFKPPASVGGWKKRVLKAYQQAREAIADIEGVSDLFVAYGSLLGQVRTQDFIAYDDDFDAGVLVDAETPAQAAEHYFRIVKLLKERGHKVTTSEIHIGNFHIHFSDLPPIDIFLFYYRECTKELCSYNLAHVCGKDVILPLKHDMLVETPVLVPNKADVLLAATYGENWQIPDPYFQWNMTPRHDLLKHTYQAASRAVENEEVIPVFNDPWLSTEDTLRP